MSGRYPAGSALPSIQALRAQHDVSTTTVRRAVDELVRAGLVEARVGSGTYVLDGSPSATVEERVAALEAGQRELADRLDRLEGKKRPRGK